MRSQDAPSCVLMTDHHEYLLMCLHAFQQQFVEPARDFLTGPAPNCQQFLNFTNDFVSIIERGLDARRVRSATSYCR